MKQILRSDWLPEGGHLSLSGFLVLVPQVKVLYMAIERILYIINRASRILASFVFVFLLTETRAILVNINFRHLDLMLEESVIGPFTVVGHDVRTKFIPKTVIVQMNPKIYLKRNLRINEITLSYIVITKICAISV